MGVFERGSLLTPAISDAEEIPCSFLFLATTRNDDEEKRTALPFENRMVVTA